MPIYEYACGACGTELEVLQKLSDPPLATCPRCGAERFRKKISAAGFRLKGGGWYVTDFKNAGKPAAKAGGSESADTPGDAKPAAAEASAGAEASAKPGEAKKAEPAKAEPKKAVND
jgi:putative FmdB family regulatory protein